MKLVIIALLALLPLKNVLAEDITDGQEDNKHSYTPFEDSESYKGMTRKDRALDSIFGKFKETHCRYQLKRACADAEIAQISRMNQLNTGPEACKAWAKECKDSIGRKEVVEIFGGE